MKIEPLNSRAQSFPLLAQHFHSPSCLLSPSKAHVCETRFVEIPVRLKHKNKMQIVADLLYAEPNKK